MQEFPDFEAEIGEIEKTFVQADPEQAPEPERYKVELGLHEGISNDEYHSGPGISSSSLKYAAKAMELYQAHKQGIVSFEETEAMRLGTAVHKLPNSGDLNLSRQRSRNSSRPTKVKRSLPPISSTRLGTWPIAF